MDLINKNRDMKPSISTEHHGDIMGTYHQQINDLDLSRNGAAKWQSSNGDNYAKLLDYGETPFSDRPCVGNPWENHPLVAQQFCY
jgi:hypothetical protein